MSIHGWIYQGHDIKSITDMQRHFPKVWGFVYKLVLRKKDSNIIEFEYIGKKNVYTKRKRIFGKKEVESIADKRKKNYEHVIKEGDWKNYISSNKYIKGNYTKFDIYREILMFSGNDHDLSYKEAKEIICSGALENDKFLNDGVSIRRFGKKVI